ncbi:MAG TPA: type IV-A pilus assembly ATPase PilB [Thermoanaerobaculia bacterium]|nr:type IV-A pilus assembly ATPase PilB [Thermoanaerobaculia bacterium]HUM30548.1 type IV-A pilus assembly ATPase PilB [Thermoanaerobaculia bacterium]HXK68740.1 type IV-A pilus assembly ATPase PilB [Thermoanaerobaculia bacterium]
MALRLGELLVKSKLISEQQLQEALNFQKEKGGKLGEALVGLGLITEQDITEVLSQQFGVPAIDLEHFEIDENVVKIIPADVARKYHVMPVSRTGATLTLAMGDPTNVFAIDDIKFLTGYNVEPVIASESAIHRAIDNYYGTTHAVELKKVMDDIASAEDAALEVMEEDEEMDLAELEAESEQAPVVRLVNLILTDAVKRGASDIHIEPYEKIFRVRFRIDGVLYEVMNPPMKLRDAIISRVKILSKLDIAEKRLPQDGRIKLKMKLQDKSKDLDLRVSVLPTLFGEKIVMRLLDKDNLMLDMTRLGFEPESLKYFEEAIFRPWGMVLVTGPTGSGKTNTLYSAIQRINTPEVNIMTAEDPVEFNLAGVNQVQMHEAIGLNFAATLRSFLRQDPNIILVGEIRDFETAEIAVKAALTGHLVLSTLHTNDAPSSVTRMVNMGIEPFLVATSVNLIAAQRLVRRVCQNCKEEVDVPPQALINIGFTPEEAKSINIVKGKGCEKCNNTGHKGRVALYEVMAMTDDLRELILSGASAMELKQRAVEEGMLSLRRSGLVKIMNGITSIEEVVRETVA